MVSSRSTKTKIMQCVGHFTIGTNRQETVCRNATTARLDLDRTRTSAAIYSKEPSPLGRINGSTPSRQNRSATINDVNKVQMITLIL